MRLGSWYAREQRMVQRFTDGTDVHGAVAEEIGCPRSIAKRINFGVIYGVGADGLVDNLRKDGVKMALDEAQHFLKQYRREYPAFDRLRRYTQAQAENNGFITLWTGRRRHYDEANPTHKAMSNLIQGGIAEVLRVATARVDALIEEHFEGLAHMLQIHDDILFEVREEIAYEFLMRAREQMQDFPFEVPLITEAKVGQRWSDMEEVE